MYDCLVLNVFGVLDFAEYSLNAVAASVGPVVRQSILESYNGDKIDFFLSSNINFSVSHKFIFIVSILYFTQIFFISYALSSQFSLLSFTNHYTVLLIY